MDIKEFAKLLGDHAKENRDAREKKPFVIFNINNFEKYLTLPGDSWMLKIGNHSIHLIQPNDIAIYINIAQTGLKKAREFYSEYIEFYSANSGPGAIIPIIPEYEVLYFDYFESITQAIIFSITALETFSNICLPEKYQFIDNKGKTISKERIERYYSLDDKLKYILRDILNTTDPTTEKWWTDFEKLKDIRDKVIHSKPSSSEDRYSQFLSPEIFETIACYNDILRYYGNYISLNCQQLLDEFPYGFGFDEFSIKYVSDEEYKKWYKNLYNPWSLSDEADKYRSEKPPKMGLK